MPTAEEMAARKSMQEAEGKLRAQQNAPRDDQGNNAPDPVTDPVLDPSAPPEPAPPAGQDNQEGNTGGPQGRPKPIYMSPADEARAAMAKRFRRDDKGVVPFNGDMTDPEMLYGEHAREDLAGVDEQQQEQQQQEPRQETQQQHQPEMITLTVRGKPVTKSREEWLADAAKVSAADSYLDEGREILENARSLRRDNRERDPADPHRPEDQNNTQDGLSDPSLSADPQHPEDELEGAIEELRYGTDPKEAANKLRNVITRESDKAADERQLKRLIGNDDQKSAKALKEFSDANPELANDRNAQMLIASNIYAIQREELIGLGITEDKLPKDNQAVAQWHQHWRIHGHPVSNQQQMLEKAKGRFEEWKGVSKPAQQQQQRKEPPRIEVSVNRDERRAQIPNQPTRSMTPPTAPNRQQQNAPRSRSDVIAGMRKQRGQIVA